MKKLSIILTVLGALATLGIVAVRSMMSAIREDVDVIRENAKSLSPSSEKYNELMEDTWPLLEELETLDLLSKALLVAGPLMLIVGVVLFLRSRKKS